MKDFRNIKKEYGLILRWINGGGDDEGNTWEITLWLENVYDPEKEPKYRIAESDGTVINQEAYDFIRQKTLNGFRGGECYDNYIELFKKMGLHELKGLKGIMGEKEMSITKLSNLTYIPRSTISSIYHRDYELKDASLEKCVKIADALEISVEKLYYNSYFDRV